MKGNKGNEILSNSLIQADTGDQIRTFVQYQHVPIFSHTCKTVSIELCWLVEETQQIEDISIMKIIFHTHNALCEIKKSERHLERKYMDV